MRPAREIMCDLSTTGLTSEQTALMLELMAAVALDARPTVDHQAERRRAKDRERKRANPPIPRKSAEVDKPAPPNDIYSNPPGNPGETNVSPPPFAEIVVSDWNAKPAANGARKATKLDASRRALLAARVRDHGEDAVLAGIANLGRSRFHCGENERGWRVDLGWFLKASNCLKAIEMAEPEGAKPALARQWTDEEKREYVAKVAHRAEGLAAVPDRPPKPVTRGPTAIASLIPQFAHGHH